MGSNFCGFRGCIPNHENLLLKTTYFYKKLAFKDYSMFHGCVTITHPGNRQVHSFRTFFLLPSMSGFPFSQDLGNMALLKCLRPLDGYNLPSSWFINFRVRFWFSFCCWIKWAHAPPENFHHPNIFRHTWNLAPMKIHTHKKLLIRCFWNYTKF